MIQWIHVLQNTFVFLQRTTLVFSQVQSGVEKVPD